MYSGIAAPSFSSAAIKSFDQEQLQVGANVDAQAFGGQNNQSPSDIYGHQIQAPGDINGQLPSYSAFGHGQGNSLNQFQDGTVNRGLGQTDGFVGSPKGPSFTAFGHGQGNSYNQDGTFNRGHADWYGQPPSVGSMGHGVVSHPSGGGDHYPDGQAPSLSDVAKRDASQTGSSFTGNQGIDPQEFVGMSLVGKNFKKFYPTAYYKEK